MTGENAWIANEQRKLAQERMKQTSSYGGYGAQNIMCITYYAPSTGLIAGTNQLNSPLPGYEW